MAKLSKYSKLRPKVSVLTFIIVGLVFIALTTAIVLSIDTPKQKFEKRYNLDKNHVFELSTLKKVEKEIDKANEVLVLFNIEEVVGEGEQASTLFPRLLSEIKNITSDEKDSAYDKLTEADIAKFSKVYVVTISTKEKDQELFADFLEKYELKVTKPKGLLVHFNETAVTAEFDNKTIEDLVATDTEKATLIINLKEFIGKI